jgi:hypothetical protein
VFHTHPALVQTLLDDRYRRLHQPHGIPVGLNGVTRPSTVRAMRRSQRRIGH